MKAMIFAAGLGTRLKPFTLEHPKALVPVGGMPMLRRVIERLKDAGIEEMVVNVHHFASQIVEYLKDNDNFGLDIHISDESGLLLDTGGGVLAARRWLGDDDFVMHNADILTDIDIETLAREHRLTKSLATLLVADRPTSRYLLFDNDMRMHGWTNINTSEVRPAGLDTSDLDRLAFGGVHIASPAIFDALQSYADRMDQPADQKVFSITDFYVSACSDFTISGYSQPADKIWLDVGKPESLARAETVVK